METMGLLSVNIINPLIAVDKPLSDENVQLGFGYKTSGGELGTALKLGKSVDNFTVRGSGSFVSAGPYDLANVSTKQANSSKFMTSGGKYTMMVRTILEFLLDKLEAVYQNPGPEGEENMTSLNPTRNTINLPSSTVALNYLIFEKFNLEGTVSEYNHAERTGDGNNHNITFFNDIYESETSLRITNLYSIKMKKDY